MTNDQMGIDIPIALLRDIAIRMRVCAANAKRDPHRKASGNTHETLASEATRTMSVKDLVPLSANDLCSLTGKTVRIRTPKEFTGLAPIISALMDAEEVRHGAATDGFFRGYVVPEVLSLTAHLYPENPCAKEVS
ncbi:hypothetical protein [Sinirhodobacter huangdaonensis]|uniref:Uncharacterized protein n=1 Tax=Paenirhodobacter huangdaonensis TaxID=2501515 RepID=A0A3S3LW42_9RHOB|nr:hypothetical protein [Sinirhodobacter huangdaonensis]RWR48408.1 hypothetical protein EOW66_18430 [Sinirhodobacter huangdaonensis]